LLQFLLQPVRFRRKSDGVAVRFRIQGHGEKLGEGGAQTLLVARIDVQQVRAADDLVEARGPFQRADFLEHALIVAGAADAVKHQFFAAGR